ncbi:MAG: Lrp/AsnC family transcriptional regulator [Nanoarchaeota archaeon]
MIKLTLKDRKLLYELDLNSRQSVNELSRKIGVSKTAISYKINKFEQEGIIRHFHTIVDAGKLGYISFRLYLTLENITPQKELEIIEFLKNKKQVTWLVSIEGNYDIGALILVKSVSEMNLIWKELLEKFNEYISKRFLTIMTRVNYYSRAFILNEKERNTFENNFITEPKELPLEEKEIALLQAIATNPRKSIIELASEIKTTPKTAIQKIKSLEKKGVILGYRTAFDYKKLGYKYVKVMFRLNRTNNIIEKRFQDYIKQNPFIVYKDEVLGGEDIEIELNVKNQEHLREIMKEIKDNFGQIIKENKTLWYYKEHKYLFLPVIWH